MPNIPLPDAIRDPHYYLSFSTPQEALVEIFPERTTGDGLTSVHNSGLLATLFRFTNKADLARIFSRKNFQNYFLRCYEINGLIASSGNKVLKVLDIDPVQFQIICIPHEIYLRMALEQDWGKHGIATITSQSVFYATRRGSAGVYFAGGGKSGPNSSPAVCPTFAHSLHKFGCRANQTGLVRLAIVRR